MEFNRQSLDVITLGHLQETLKYMEELNGNSKYIVNAEYLNIAFEHGLEAYLDEIYLTMYENGLDISRTYCVNFLEDENISLEDVLYETFDNAISTNVKYIPNFNMSDYSQALSMHYEGASISRYGLIFIRVEDKKKYIDV